MKVLLDQGADPTIQNNRGHDAVFEAELNDRTEVVEFVLKEGGEGLESGLGGESEGEGGDGDEDMAEGSGDVEVQESEDAAVEGKGKGKENDLQEGVDRLKINVSDTKE